MTPHRFVPVESPILPAERYHLPPLLDRTQAQGRAWTAICEGKLRPADAEQRAHIEELTPLFVPFWRIDLTRADDAVTFRQGSIIPGLDIRRRRKTWMVCARSAFPYEMKAPGGLWEGHVRALEVNLAALVAGDPAAPGWETVDADVAEPRARKIAGDAFPDAREHGEDRITITNTELTVHAAHFVRFPLWLARYRYQGEAAPDGGTFHVTLSALDGIVVGAHHPSRLRAGAARIKGFFGSLVDGFRERPEARDDAPPDPPPAEVPDAPPDRRVRIADPSAREAPRDLKLRFAEHVKRVRGKR